MKTLVLWAARAIIEFAFRPGRYSLITDNTPTHSEQGWLQSFTIFGF